MEWLVAKGFACLFQNAYALGVFHGAHFESKDDPDVVSQIRHNKGCEVLKFRFIAGEFATKKRLGRRKFRDFLYYYCCVVVNSPSLRKWLSISTSSLWDTAATLFCFYYNKGLEEGIGTGLGRAQKYMSELVKRGAKGNTAFAYYDGRKIRLQQYLLQVLVDAHALADYRQCSDIKNTTGLKLFTIQLSNAIQVESGALGLL